MMKIIYNDNARIGINSQNIKKELLTSLIQEELLDYELEDEQDIILLFKMNSKNTSVVGRKEGSSITITHVAANPLIVER